METKNITSVNADVYKKMTLLGDVLLEIRTNDLQVTGRRPSSFRKAMQNPVIKTQEKLSQKQPRLMAGTLLSVCNPKQSWYENESSRIFHFHSNPVTQGASKKC